MIAPMTRIASSLLVFFGSLALTFAQPTGWLISMPPGNLVVNGGFESGFGGWQGTYGWLDAPGVALEGTRAGVVIDTGSSSVGQPMWQLLPTTPGAQYHFQFSLLSGYGLAGEQSQGNLGSPVNVYWGGDLFGAGGQYLGVFHNTSTTTWATYDFQVTATSSSTMIQFIDYIDMRWQLIDAISVVRVPEPAGAALVLCGLVLLGIHARRRR